MNQLFKELKKLTIDWMPEVAAPSARRGVILLPSKRGCGATMIARRIPQLIPTPQHNSLYFDRLKIWGMAGLLDIGQSMAKQLMRVPFRAPHHTCSQLGMGGSGSGMWPHPGEVHFAHGGVLLLDEAEEFKRDALMTAAIAWHDGRSALHNAPMIKMPSEFFLVLVVYDHERWKKILKREGELAAFLRRLVPMLVVEDDAREIAAEIPME